MPVGTARIPSRSNDASNAWLVEPFEIRDHDVGFDSRKVDPKPGNLREALGQTPCIGVIVGQPGRHLLQSDQTRSRQHPDLPHSASHHFAHSPRFLDELPAPQEQRAYRSTQAFGQTEHDAIAAKGQPGRRFTQCRRSIEDPGSVQMDRQAVLPGPGDDPVETVRREHRAARHVVRVLQSDQAGSCTVIDGGTENGLNEFPRQQAAWSVDWPGQTS